MMRGLIIGVILHIAFYTLVITGLLFVWVSVGEENLRGLWEFQTEPWRDWWDVHGSRVTSFFDTTARPYLSIVYVVVAILIIARFLELSVWIAKVAVALYAAFLGLHQFGDVNLGAPPAWMLWGAIGGALWIVFMLAVINGSLGQIAKNIHRRLTS